MTHHIWNCVWYCSKYHDVIPDTIILYYIIHSLWWLAARLQLNELCLLQDTCCTQEFEGLLGYTVYSVKPEDFPAPDPATIQTTDSWMSPSSFPLPLRLSQSHLFLSSPLSLSRLSPSVAKGAVGGRGKRPVVWRTLLLGSDLCPWLSWSWMELPLTHQQLIQSLRRV